MAETPRHWKRPPGQWADAPRPAGWHKIRRRIFERDDWRCQLRLDVCVGRAREVDHIGSQLDHNDANLRAVCMPCHRKHTGSKGGQTMARRAASRRRPTEPHPGLLRPDETPPEHHGT